MKTYMTVFTNKNYLGGVKVLKKSLELVSSKYPLTVLIPEGIDEEIIEELIAENISYSTVKPFDDSIFKAENTVSHWKDTFFKLEIFNQLSYDKIVFLDADMVVLKNIDALFDYPHMSCVAAGQELHDDWGDLNSGIMVLEPNSEDYYGLMKLVPEVYKTRMSQNLGVGDQDVIKAYFSDWKGVPELHIPGEYNVMVGYAGPLAKKGNIKGINDIYVYHFTGEQKPWSRKIIDDIAILLKMIIRGKSMIDIRAFFKYKNILKQI